LPTSRGAVQGSIVRSVRGRQLNPPKWIDEAALRYRAINDELKKERGYPVTPFDPNRIHAE